jgi:hypothetical protein
MRRQVCMLLFLMPIALAQINVQVQILNATDNSTIQQNSLNQQLQAQNLSTATVISSSLSSQVAVQQCGTGTYAEVSSTVCQQCAAGTASPVVGATDRFTCQTCSPGSWSLTQSSSCTLCPTNTFSPNAAAPSQASCLACPPNSNALVGSDMITKCSCNDRYFIPTNTLQVLDPPSAVQFGSWAALALNVVLVNQAHLAC